MGFLPAHHLIIQLLFILGVCETKLCVIKQQPDPTNYFQLRWVLPYVKDDICTCTKVELQKCSGIIKIPMPEANYYFYTDDPNPFVNAQSLNTLRIVLGCDENADTNIEAPADTKVSTKAIMATNPTEASTDTKAPTPTEVLTNTEAPTPTEASRSVEAPTPTEASTSAEAPTPAEASTSVEAPTPTEASTSEEAPTPTEASTSGKVSTPKEASFEAPTRTEASSTTRDNTSYSMLISTTASPDCNEYLGMKNGNIPDANIRASSQFHDTPASNARLIYGLSWATDEDLPWIQADIGYQTNVSGVITQGETDGGDFPDWVTSFKVSSFLMSNEDLERFVSDENGSVLVFSGNVDSHTLKISTFPELVYAQIVRITCLTKAHGYWQMRFEVLGCKLD